MKKSVIYFVVVMAMLCIAPLAMANHWYGNSGDGDWFNAGNWDPGIPTSSDEALIYNDPAGSVVMPTISTGSAECSILRLGHGVDYVSSVTVDGGTLTVSNCIAMGHEAGGTGVLSISDGIINVNGDGSGTEYVGSIRVGYGGDGILSMTGGVINLFGQLTVGTWTGGVYFGQVNLSGGTINAGSVGIIRESDENRGNIDLAGGKIVMDGDWVDDVSAYVLDDRITVHGGDTTDSFVLITYDDVGDTTTVEAAWDCVDRPAGDINGDCVVDLIDFAEVANTWLDSGEIIGG